VSNLLERFGRSVSAGEYLFREDDSGNEMFVVQSGKVRLTKTVRGKEQVLAEIGAGDFFGEMSILNAKPRNATAQVIEDATFLVLDPKTFEAMIKANTEIAVRLIKKLATRLDEADTRIENLLLKDVNSRVVHHVITQARADGEQKGAGFSLELSASAAAAQIGVEQARVDDVLARMERSQLLTRQGDRLEIPDINRLDEFLDFLEMREQFGGV
jgi:CRP-like cAMP-binding protein